MTAPAVRGTRAVVDVRHALDHIQTRTGEAMVAMRGGQDPRVALTDALNWAEVACAHLRTAVAVYNAHGRVSGRVTQRDTYEDDHNGEDLS